MSSDNEFNFEKILRSVGDKGIYQKRLLWLFIIPLNFIIPWTILVQIFQASVPDHWCHVPNKPENVTVDQWKNMTIPWEEKEDVLQWSSCNQYENITSDPNANTSITSCQQGWEYNTTWYDNTLPMQQNWVCTKDSYPSNWLSVGIAGNVIGTIIFNVISDFIGRKPILIVVIQLYAVSAIAKLYVTSNWALGLTMFINSLAFPPVFEVANVLVLEQVSGSMRAEVTSMSFNMWTAGMSFLPLLAWLCRDWVLLGIVTAVPFFPFIIGIWLLNESPRWTLTTGRVTETVKILENIAKVNGTERFDIKKAVDDYVMTNKANIEEQSYLSFLELFTKPTIRKRTILLTFAYICNNLVYYGLVYNISNMSGNEFINFFLISITELPATFLAWYCAQNFGRRWSEVGFLALCTFCTSIAAYIPSTWGVAMTTILVICKSVINGSFLVIYLQMTELYPTSHRASGAGLSSIVASLFGISSPYIAYSSKYWFKLPYVIFFLLSLAGTIVTSCLPETLGAKMPQNLKEADEFLKNQPFWSYYGKTFRKRKISDINISVIAKNIDSQTT